MRPSFLACALVLASAAQADASVLLCVGDKSSGFWWDGSAWTTSTFNVDEDRFVVRSPNPETPEYYEVTKLGSSAPTHVCSRPKIGDALSSRILCGGQAHGMIIDHDHMRFQVVYGFGFIDGKDSNADTPNMTIGRCSEISN